MVVILCVIDVLVRYWRRCWSVDFSIAIIYQITHWPGADALFLSWWWGNKISNINTISNPIISLLSSSPSITIEAMMMIFTIWICHFLKFVAYYSRRNLANNLFLNEISCWRPLSKFVQYYDVVTVFFNDKQLFIDTILLTPVNRASFSFSSEKFLNIFMYIFHFILRVFEMLKLNLN